MVRKSQIYNDELDLIELGKKIWIGRWKIIVIMVITTVSVFTYQAIKNNSTKVITENFTSTTQIKPISTLEENKYIIFNKLNMDVNRNITEEGNTINVNDIDYFNAKMTISKSKLLNLYIEILDEKTVFEDAIRKNKLLDATKYSNEILYSDAITKLASTIVITRKEENVNKFANVYIEFIYHDEKKWKLVLEDVNKATNKAIKVNLLNQYDRLFLFEKKKNDYRINDIDTKIDNLIYDYTREASDRLEFLKEQSKIAKTLGISKNTIELQTFDNKKISFDDQDILLSKIKTDSPFYLRGSEAIDKEIELINTRNNKKAFIPGLFQLEKIKRNIEQNKSLERAKLHFLTTPLANDKIFSAALLKINSTDFRYNNINNPNLSVPMPLPIVLGLIFGVLYVLISSAIQSQKIYKKK